MPVISECPKCRQPVTIPDGLAPDAEVRCPLCVVVYRLSEAMADLPPALVPVETGAITGAAPDSDATLKSNLVSEPFHVPDSPKTEAEQPDEKAGDIEDGQDAGGAPPTINTGQTPVDSEAFAGFRIKGDPPEDEPAGGTPSKRPRPKRRKEKSAAKEILGAILGGFLGLAAGYYALNYFGGKRFDFLEVYLPGVEHTYPHPGASEEGNPKKSDTKTPPQESKLEPDPQSRCPLNEPKAAGGLAWHGGMYSASRLAPAATPGSM